MSPIWKSVKADEKISRLTSPNRPHQVHKFISGQWGWDYSTRKYLQASNRSWEWARIAM